MLLNKSQAMAIANAMAACNDISGCLHVRILSPNGVLHVKEYLTDEVAIWDGDTIGNPTKPYQHENYVNQAAFLNAYNLG